jgi:quinol monooxygenase YgiN
MSVLVTLKVPADGTRLEEFANARPDVFKTIVERGKEFGVIKHHIWASADTVLVVDEWPDEASFQSFFAASPEIKDVMESAGATGPPEISFWRKLNTGDDV